MVDESLNKIHELIEEPRLKYQLTSNNINWNRLCSSLDVIRDSQRALGYYKKSNFPNNRGGQYFYICGLLQTLCMQQDAVRDLSLPLGVTIKFHRDYPKLHKIRNIRNDAIGHPTSRSGYTFHFLYKFSKKTFSYQSALPEGGLLDIHIDTKEILSIQEKFIVEIITNLNNKLQGEMMKHKKSNSCQALTLDIIKIKKTFILF